MYVVGQRWRCRMWVGALFQTFWFYFLRHSDVCVCVWWNVLVCWSMQNVGLVHFFRILDLIFQTFWCGSIEIFMSLVNAASVEWWVGALFQTFGSYCSRHFDMCLSVWWNIRVVSQRWRCRMLGWRVFSDCLILFSHTFWVCVCV